MVVGSRTLASQQHGDLCAGNDGELQVAMETDSRAKLSLERQKLQGIGFWLAYRSSERAQNHAARTWNMGAVFVSG